VIAIYARENGQGMAFPAPAPVALPGPGDGNAASTPLLPSQAPSSRSPLRDASRGNEGDASRVVHLVSGEGASDDTSSGSSGTPPTDPDDSPRPPGGARPSLKRIK
jgi:stringent starvation protein B